METLYEYDNGFFHIENISRACYHKALEENDPYPHVVIVYFSDENRFNYEQIRFKTEKEARECLSEILELVKQYQESLKEINGQETS